MIRIEGGLKRERILADMAALTSDLHEDPEWVVLIRLIPAEKWPVERETLGATHSGRLMSALRAIPVIIQSGLSPLELIETVCHELVHCEQIRRGDLSSNRHGPTWKGELIWSSVEERQAMRRRGVAEAAVSPAEWEAYPEGRRRAEAFHEAIRQVVG